MFKTNFPDITKFGGDKNLGSAPPWLQAWVRMWLICSTESFITKKRYFCYRHTTHQSYMS